MKNYKNVLLSIGLLLNSNLYDAVAQRKHDYKIYHQNIIKAEKLIADEKYKDALLSYKHVFSSYDFIFLKDYQVATQLALYVGEKDDAFTYLRRGIVGGWTKKEIKKNRYLVRLKDFKELKNINKERKSLEKKFIATLNMELRKKVKKMFKKDQWKAIGALFTFTAKGQDRYAEKKFAPHSQQQMAKLFNILENSGYAGEKLIGNGLWMTVILSHHNSISSEYVRKDTLYPFVKPLLLEAIKKGELCPYDYGVIEDWYVTVKTDRKEAAFGYLNPLKEQELPKSNELRQNIGMRSVEIRNQLVDIQEKTGMDFYLAGSPWVDGKITVTR